MTPALTHARIQFLRAASHSIGVHADAIQPRDPASSDSDEEQATKIAKTCLCLKHPHISSGNCTTGVWLCDVCLIAPREGFVLIPCGYARLCESYVNAVSSTRSGCPVCGTKIEY